MDHQNRFKFCKSGRQLIEILDKEENKRHIRKCIRYYENLVVHLNALAKLSPRSKFHLYPLLVMDMQQNIMSNETLPKEIQNFLCNSLHALSRNWFRYQKRLVYLKTFK